MDNKVRVVVPASNLTGHFGVVEVSSKYGVKTVAADDDVYVRVSTEQEWQVIIDGENVTAVLDGQKASTALAEAWAAGYRHADNGKDEKDNPYL